MPITCCRWHTLLDELVRRQASVTAPPPGEQPDLLDLGRLGVEVKAAANLPSAGLDSLGPGQLSALTCLE